MMEDIKNVENMEPDNSKLERIMEKDPENMTLEDQKIFLDILKESQLYLPIEITSDIFKDIGDVKVGDTVEAEEPLRFKPIRLNGQNNRVALPLFTSNERMKEAGANVSSIAIYMEDLADMLKQARDEFDEVIINPFTRYNMGMSLENFLNIFK